jgi:hypothetical protein
VYNADGGRNKLGDISGYVDLEMKFGDHKEKMRLYATSLGQERIIIGHDWLRKHNPDINWETGDVTMSRCPTKSCGHVHRQKRAEKQKKERVRLRESRKKLDQWEKELEHESMQPSVKEVEDDYDQELRIRRYILDPYEWDPSAEHSPTEEEMDDLCAELLGEKEWSEEEETRIQLNEHLKAMGMNRRARRVYIRATTSKSAELAAAANAKKEKKTFEQMVPEWAHDYKPVFDKNDFDEMPPNRPWDHKIELNEGAQPWDNVRLIPLSDEETKALDDFLEENLRTGRIRESKSPWASPFFFAKKKDGKLRPVQDYRRLNAITKKNRTPLPLITETIDRLKEAKYFTKMDVRWGFNNIRITEGDQEKAAFLTKRGLFEPTVMFFGLTNSPATFQTMMNHILRPLIKRGKVLVYMDDIIVFTQTTEEHRRVVREVLEVLKENKLFLKPEKCEFEQTTVEYLGVIVSHNTLSVDPIKTDAVRDWPMPKKLKEVQEFTGFLNFYRRFVPNFSRIARPLYDLTKKNERFDWTLKCKEAFEELKDRICSAPILRLARDNGRFRIEADACDYATGAVLSQEQEGVYHPIAFYSKSLNEVERNYPIHDREMLAIVRALYEWRHYVIGKEFDIWSDHKNLSWFMTKQDLNRRQARWGAELAEYNFILHYRKGITMGVADGLSRRADLRGGIESDNTNQILLPTHRFANLRALSGILIHSTGDAIVKEIRKSTKEYDLKVTKALEEAKRSPGNKAGDMAMWEKEDGIITRNGLIVVPRDREIRRKIIAEYHDTLTAGHPGRLKTRENVQRDYWWPRMISDVNTYVDGCPICPKVKPVREKPVGELKPTEIPTEPWDIITVDFVGELPESQGHNAIMNVVDRHSKLLYSGACDTKINAEGAARLFLDTAWRYEGLPRQIISDRGPQFAAAFTTELNRLLRIKGSKSTAYHPQTDGQTERVNQEMEIYLRIFINHHQNDWAEWLSLATFSWNAKIDPTTKRSPFEKAHGRQPRLGMEPTRESNDPRIQSANDMVEKMKKVTEETESALKAAAEDMKRFYDAKHRPEEFRVGDRVWLNAKDLTTERPSKKLDYKRLGPFEIIRKVNDLAYELKLPRSFKIHPVISASRLEKAKDDEWNRPQPRVTLKVRDPQSGEFINTLESKRKIWKLTPGDFAQITFKPLPEPFTELTEDDQF